VLLALVPPHIASDVQLPPDPPALPVGAAGDDVPVAVRESLRLRARWVQELTARVALVLGQRLVERGAVDSAEAIVNLRFEELQATVESRGRAVLDLRDAVDPAPPLPAAFRLTDDGVVVPFRADHEDGGKGAGGGRGTGPVHIGADGPPEPGDVLVVRTLDPGLAGVLPGLGGLVAETGSVLSHLAILAREYGVPTVVGLADATERFTPGTWVVVDGSTGEVSGLTVGEWGAA
jgi:pyruvate,water dikinase